MANTSGDRSGEVLRPKLDTFIRVERPRLPRATVRKILAGQPIEARYIVPKIKQSGTTY